MTPEALERIVRGHQEMSPDRLWDHIRRTPADQWWAGEAYEWAEAHAEEVDAFVRHAVSVASADVPPSFVSALTSVYLHAIVHVPDAYDICLALEEGFLRRRLAAMVQEMEGLCDLARSPDSTISEADARAQVEAFRTSLRPPRFVDERRWAHLVGPPM